MQLSAACMACLISHQEKFIRDYPDEVKKAAFMKDALALVGASDRETSAPYATKLLNDLHRRHFGFSEDLSELKRQYNGRMLRLSPAISAAIRAADEPLKAALQFARAGNYIDFGAMDSVDDEKLHEILFGAQQEALDGAEYARFTADLARARSFVLVADNAGEIVMDRLLVEEIARTYPDLRLTVLVRGALTSNDATLEDAREVGLDRVARVLGNGTDIAGTEMDMISAQARSALLEADVLLAKGQGNFETLSGCGLNVYYMFLNKCDWFVRRFQKPRFSGMFVSELRLPPMKYL